MVGTLGILYAKVRNNMERTYDAKTRVDNTVDKNYTLCFNPVDKNNKLCFNPVGK